MRITLICVGRARGGAEQEICDAFLKNARVAGKKLGFTQIELVIVETSRARSAELRIVQEADRLAKRIPSGAHQIVLDERGVAQRSDAFAARLATLRDTGLRDLVFVIGGPDGLAADFHKDAVEKISLGSQTWPHLFVRAMLAEQVFRGFTILSGHPYHRGG